MTKLLLALVLFTGLWADKYPKEVTGKWIVENVDMPPEMIAKIPEQQRDVMIYMMKQGFNNASFDLKPDHHCAVSVAMPNMPKNSYWAYDPAHGILKLSETKDDPRALEITVTEVNGKIYFTMQRAHVVLRVHKGKAAS